MADPKSSVVVYIGELDSDQVALVFAYVRTVTPEFTFTVGKAESLMDDVECDCDDEDCPTKKEQRDD